MLLPMNRIKSTCRQKNGAFTDQIVPIDIEEVYVDDNGKSKRNPILLIETKDQELIQFGSIGKLRPVFANNGSVTAGNSSQTSDGAAVF
ncbi:MAG: hypothetical protein CM15mP59_4570 [Flavobacteriaceae bacterium]|nr:MAG: hypothetical protein CM15mP59_4570 [Flavobacteriaceae bacterium]